MRLKTVIVNQAEICMMRVVRGTQGTEMIGNIVGIHGTDEALETVTAGMVETTWGHERAPMNQGMSGRGREKGLDTEREKSMNWNENGNRESSEKERGRKSERKSEKEREIVRFGRGRGNERAGNKRIRHVNRGRRPVNRGRHLVNRCNHALLLFRRSPLHQSGLSQGPLQGHNHLLCIQPGLQNHPCHQKRKWKPMNQVRDQFVESFVEACLLEMLHVDHAVCSLPVGEIVIVNSFRHCIK